MALPEPENTQIDHPTLDSGIHIRDSKTAQANLWQMVVAALLVVGILSVFFYGLTEQRNEVPGVATKIAGGEPQPKGNVAAPLGADQQKASAGKANTAAPAPATNQAPPQTTTGSAPAR